MAVQHIGEPVVHASWGGINGSMRTVDGDIVLSQEQDDFLVRVVQVTDLSPRKMNGSGAEG